MTKEVAIEGAVEAVETFAISGFMFPTYARRLAVDSQRRYLLAVGGYPSEIKVFDLGKKHQKFARGIRTDAVDALFLGRTSKIALLHDTNDLGLHGLGAPYARIKIPIGTNKMAFDGTTSELLAGGYRGEVCVLNLELGLFTSPIKVHLARVNDIQISMAHGIRAVSGCQESGAGRTVFVDPRQAKIVGGMELPSSVSHTRHGPDGISIVVGCDNGETWYYDLRSAAPISVYRGKGRVDALEMEGRNVLVAMGRSVYLVDFGNSSGRRVAGLRPCDVSDICVTGNIMHVAYSEPEISSFIIRDLARTPEWALGEASHERAL